MNRFLGLDVGSKRIGVAISDPLFITGQPVKTINRTSDANAIAEINEICKEYNVSVIVVGLPKNMNGTLGSQAIDTQNFANLIKEHIGINIEFVDERLTSKEAERYLIELNKKPSRNKGLIDMASAVIILQQYLDRRR